MRRLPQADATVDIKTVGLHRDFPTTVWIVIEQPRHEPYRFSYDAVRGLFVRTAAKSLLHERGFGGAYGWIGGMGAPPEPHCDALLLTGQAPAPGDVLVGHICGVFQRQDGDHKFVALDAEWRYTVARADLASLDRDTREELARLYPRVGEHEGWYGAVTAWALLKARRAAHGPGHEAN